MIPLLEITPNVACFVIILEESSLLMIDYFASKSTELLGIKVAGQNPNPILAKIETFRF